jgi:diguanylate cyclase (GGDEF)-like protein/PAS domain S-box-containing protein
MLFPHIPSGSVLQGLAPVLLAVQLYPPFTAWLEHSLARFFILIFVAALSVSLLLSPLNLAPLPYLLSNAAGLVVVLSPVLVRLWHQHRQKQETLLRLETLIDTLPDAVLFKDGAGRWQAANPVARALFRIDDIPWQGKSEEALIAQRPDLAETHWATGLSDEQTWTKGFLDVSMETVPDIHGNIRHFEITKVPLYEQDGRRRALVVVGREVTDRIVSEENLRLAASVFESSREGIMITTAGKEPSILRVNKAFCDITGYTPAEITGGTPRILQSGRHDAGFYHEMWKTLQTWGNWQGEIWNRRKDGQIVPERLQITAVKDATGNATHHVAIYEDISEIKQAHDKLEEMAHHDPLTGLPNRRLLNELLDHSIRQAARDKSRVAVLFVDLDRFKIVNDTLGHQFGDALLVQVAERISGLVRSSDLLARLGGDEFIAVMAALHNEDGAAAIARKIIHAVSQPFYINNHEVFIGASIGISLYPDDGEEPAELIKTADIAMYQVKNENRNNFRFYSKDLSASRNEKFVLENELRHAVERGQMELFYQPQFSLKSKRIIGAEALVRWRHPEFGLISPDKFIPLAEETGLILPLGEWILRQAVEQVGKWSSQQHALRSVSVNVSAIQIQRSNFSDTVYGILVETGCDPAMLELEITESTLMHNTVHVATIIERLKSLGVRLAIDDFGTGYSSMSHLKRMPMDKLKIDQSFVRDLPDDLQDAAIARAILALGHSMELAVIAEGVETAEQADFLRKIGCEEAQGYYFGKPMPAAEFDHLLANTKK